MKALATDNSLQNFLRTSDYPVLGISGTSHLSLEQINLIKRGLDFWNRQNFPSPETLDTWGVRWDLKCAQDAAFFQQFWQQARHYSQSLLVINSCQLILSNPRLGQGLEKLCLSSRSYAIRAICCFQELSDAAKRQLPSTICHDLIWLTSEQVLAELSQPHHLFRELNNDNQ